MARRQVNEVWIRLAVPDGIDPKLALERCRATVRELVESAAVVDTKGVHPAYAGATIELATGSVIRGVRECWYEVNRGWCQEHDAHWDQSLDRCDAAPALVP